MLYVHQMRTMAWMMDHTGAEKLWTNANVVWNPSEIFNPESSFDQWDLIAGEMSYGRIKNTVFAKCLWNMYQYGYLGILNERIEPMEYETSYTIMSAILHDFDRSYFLHEFVGYVGGEEQVAARRMLKMSEVANTRRILEGHHPFSLFADDFIGDSTSTGGHAAQRTALSIRQMALLAGMEEMSIRAAANKQKQRSVPLPTFSEKKNSHSNRSEKKGRTLINVDDAKTWLKAKGRYVPIMRKWETGDVDLHNRKFHSLDDAARFVMDRLNYLSSSASEGPDLIKHADAILGNNCLRGFDPNLLKDQQIVAPLADFLQFPSGLFSLRLREALAKKEIREIESALREFEQK